MASTDRLQPNRRSPREVAVTACLFLALLIGCGGAKDTTGPQSTGRETSSAVDDSHPLLVKEGYLGAYNVVRYMGRFYALAQAAGAFDVGKLRNGEYPGAFAGASVDEACRRVSESLSGPGVDDNNPVLVEEGYKGRFNVIRYRGTFYALGQDQGPFEISKVEKGSYKNLFSGKSAAEVKQRVP